MKIKKIVFVVLMLMITPFFGLQATAHPPSDMILQYDYNLQELDVTITHVVSVPSSHYIYKVEVEKNEFLYDTFLYDSQPTTNTFTYTYSVLAENGDKIRVTAFCNIAGSIQKTMNDVKNSSYK